MAVDLDRALAPPAPSPAAEAFRGLRRNPVAVVSGTLIVLLVLIAIFAPVVAPYAYDKPDRSYASLPAPGDARHLFGTDHLGQDVLSRVIYGARVSLSVGVVVELIEVLIGVTLGLLAAYKGGLWDTILMRVTDAMFAFPDLLFAILLVGILRPSSGIASFFTVFAALALVNWPGMARLVRGQALALREKEYVEAARAIGVSDWGIITRHLLPNMLSPIIVAVTVDIANVILAEATLSFLGIGIQRPYPSWGRMINDAIPYLRSAPLLMVYPAVMLGMVVLSFNFLGDALRDALDPPDALVSVRLVTYNIRGGLGMDGRRSTRRIADAVRALDPDVICFQEVHQRLPWSGLRDQPGILARLLHMRVLFAATMRVGPGAYGLAVATPLPVLADRFHLLPNSRERARRMVRLERRGVMEVRVATPFGPLTVLNTHWSLDAADRLEAARIVGEVPAVCETFVTLVGDLNAGADSPEIRALVAASGLADLGAATNVPTFPSPLPTSRIDYVLCSPGLSVDRFEVVEGLGSDHRMVVVEVDHLPD